MNCNISFAFLTLAFLFIGCKPNYKTNETKQLFDEVMKIHDDVMPKMSDIHKLKKSLRSTLKNEQLTDSLKTSVILLIKDLDTADDGMMDWMAEFKPPSDTAPNEEIMQYLTAEKGKISSVSDDMLRSIKNATDFLNKSPNNEN